MILCGERADDTAVGLCPGNLLKIQWRFVASLIKLALCRFVWNATALSDGRGGAERMIRQVLQA